MRTSASLDDNASHDKWSGHFSLFSCAAASSAAASSAAASSVAASSAAASSAAASSCAFDITLTYMLVSLDRRTRRKRFVVVLLLLLLPLLLLVSGRFVAACGASSTEKSDPVDPLADGLFPYNVPFSPTNTCLLPIPPRTTKDPTA